jgi:hypothetical protein
MKTREVGIGGFFLPKIYQKAQNFIAERFKTADVDYIELSKWSFPDEFLCFVTEFELLKFMDKTYPNPRKKNEIPIWFLITCQFLLHLYQSGKYHHLNYLLNAGSILTKFGFNVGIKDIGFNDKNKKERKTVIHADSVRKFFKDTDKNEIRLWYRNDLQEWFRQKRAYNSKGIFVLDQSHLVVPDNPKYKDAIKMPVDHHGQRYSNFGELTTEQKKAIKYHPCYAISTLLNVAPDKATYHIAGYELGPGNEDELVQAERLVPFFCKSFPGLMQELIIDRGYIDGAFIGKLKRDCGVNILIPAKKSMDVYKEALAISKQKNDWVTIEKYTDEDKLLLLTEAALVNDLDIWSNLNCKLQATVVKTKKWDNQQEEYIKQFMVLLSTKKYNKPQTVIDHYRLRTQIEERFRQFKTNWYIAEFPSPHESLIESHVCFTLLTYSLLQFYFRRKDWREKTKRMITTLRMDERLGKDAVLIYSKDKYGIFDLDDYTIRVTDLNDSPRAKLKLLMETQKQTKLKREREIC